MVFAGKKKMNLLLPLLFGIIFILNRVPYYTSFTVPEIDPDSILYFHYAYHLMTFDWEILREILIDLPPGYPLFIALISLFTEKGLPILLAQSFLLMITALMLIFESQKWGRWTHFFAFAGMFFFCNNSYTIRLETAFITESVYVSTLILMTWAFLRAMRKGDHLSYLILSAVLILPLIIRSNGLYFIILLPLVAIHIYQHQSKAKIISLLLPLLSILLSWSGWNYFLKGVFLPGNLSRTTTVVSQIQERWVEEDKRFIPERHLSNSVSFKFMWHLRQPSKKLPHFYASYLPKRLENMYGKYAIVLNKEFKNYNRQNRNVPDTMTEWTFREYGIPLSSEKLNEKLNVLTSTGIKKHVLIMIYSIIYKTESLLIRNVVWTGLSVFLLLISGLMWLKSGMRNSFLLVIMVITSMYILNAFIISVGHNRYLPRYGHVCAFYIYIAPAFLPLFFKVNNSLK